MILRTINHLLDPLEDAEALGETRYWGPEAVVGGEGGEGGGVGVSPGKRYKEAGEERFGLKERNGGEVLFLFFLFSFFEI